MKKRIILLFFSILVSLTGLGTGIFIINWNIIMFPVISAKIKTVNIKNIDSINDKFIRFNATLNRIAYDSDGYKILYFSGVKNQSKIKTTGFETLKTGKSHVFTCLNLQSDNSFLVIKIDNKILFSIFFFNYIALLLSILMVVLGIIILKLYFRKVTFTPQYEIQLYNNLLHKYLTDQEIKEKIDNSKIFITPRFSSTIKALTDLFNLEKDKNKKVQIKKFIKKCLPNKSGGKNEKNNKYK